MYKGKETKVILSEEAKEVYIKITDAVEKELKKGINKSFHQTLLRSIERVKELLKENPFAGDQVKKRQIPPKYIIKYNVNNIWRIELADRWRLIYTITGNQIGIIDFVLDIFNHRDYDKIFGYSH